MFVVMYPFVVAHHLYREHADYGTDGLDIDDSNGGVAAVLVPFNDLGGRAIQLLITRAKDRHEGDRMGMRCCQMKILDFPNFDTSLRCLKLVQ